METDKKLEELSRVAACTFVVARAFNLWVQKLESRARSLRQCFNHETKLALNDIVEGCKRVERGLNHFENWALEAGVTESGHTGDAQALNAYMNDGAWVAQLTGYTFNATHDNDNARTVIKSYCKSQTKGEPMISYELLEEFNPTI